MTLLIGAVGWGLLSFGALTHVWHQARLRQLLAMHLDNDAPAAVALTAAEVFFATALPAAYLADIEVLAALSVAAAVLAAGFIAWIARLLVTGSDLPCACSLSDEPTSLWSLGRAVCTALVGAFALADPSGQHVPTTIASFAVGLAIAGAVFVMPEAISWPPASRALLARIDAHRPADPMDQRS